MFKINNKNTKAMPSTSYYAPCSSVYNVNFEQVNDG